MTEPSRTRTPVAPFTCGGCTNTWTGLSRGHCGSCHRTFNRVSLFDQHRGRGDDGNGECLDPASLGLSLHEDGIWYGPPPSDEERSRLASLRTQWTSERDEPTEPEETR